MNREHLNTYIKATEAMILPESVSSVNQASKFLSRLPLRLQKYIAAKGSSKQPYMGFVVEPYSFFLSYEIADPEAAARLLPKGYRLAPVSMFAETRPRPAAVLGAFNVHTSVFWGSRLELYLIAENLETGLMSWIIAEYETNTNSYDPGRGFTGATTARSTVTTSHRGELIVDVEGRDSGKRLELEADLGQALRRGLSQRLWVEGNLSVDYGGGLDDGEGQPFGLIFDPAEMESALRLPLGDLRIARNDFGSEYLAKEPFEAACFPFAQHFVTTSMPAYIGLSDASELEGAVLGFGRRAAPSARPAAALNAAIVG